MITLVSVLKSVDKAFEFFFENCFVLKMFYFVITLVSVLKDVTKLF